MTPQEKHFTNIFRHLLSERDTNFMFMCPWGRRYFEEQMAAAIVARYKTNLAIKLLAKLNLYFLSKVVLRYEDLTPETHLPFCEHLLRNISRNTNVLPRGYFKTTISTKSASIFCIINDPNIRILLVNATATNAELMLKEIKSHFETNPYFKLLFPGLVPKNFKEVPWSNNKMQVVRTGNYGEPTIYAVGTDTNVTSGHFNLIIKDDLVNEDHLTSPEQMRKPIEWEKMSHSLYVPDSDPRKKLDWSTGTRWAYFDYMAWRLDMAEDDQKYVLSCFNKDGKSTFPERFPIVELERIRKSQSDRVFSCQYLNNPMPAETATFRKEWIQYYEDIPRDVPLRTFVLCDPAMSLSKYACDRAIIAVSIDDSKNWYVREYSSGKFPVTDEDSSGRTSLMGEIFRFHRLYQPDFFGIEDNGLQKALIYPLRDEMRRRDCFFPVNSLQPTGRETKAMRIETLSIPFCAKRVYIKKDMDFLENQLLGYGAIDNIDLIDAFSYLVKHEIAPSEPMVKDKNPLLMANIIEELKLDNDRTYPFSDQLTA